MKLHLQLFNEKPDLDKCAYIKTDEDIITNIEGVFAVGDYSQITTAIADGTIAANAVTKEIVK